MAILIDPNDIHSAADSWSGFIYQGKVALYHVLYLLNTDNNALQYSLQLDSLEDFAIVDDNINPITLHQVKAMKGTTYAEYRVAFNKLEKRINEYPCNGAYFHLANQNEKTSMQIQLIHPNLTIYQYQNGNHFCSLEQINRACEEQIESYLNSNNLKQFNNVKNVTALRNSLESIICNQIIDIHSCNHQRNGLTISEGAYNFIIPLSSFKDKLVTDPSTILNEDYFLFLSKELINHYYLEFCQDIEDEGVVEQDEKNKLARYLMQINGLNKSSLVYFIQSILPHREVKFNSILDFKDYNIQSEEFKDAFLQILYELIASTGGVGDNLIWKGDDKLIYTATAINSPKQSKKRVCKRIYKNITQTDIEVPYESDKLITTALEVESIEKELNNQSQVEENLNNINNIINWSKISLTTLENAKNKIK